MTRAGLAMLAAMLALPAMAQSWPTRPVRFIVPFGPGGPADIYARVLANELSEALGQQFVVENKAGAGGVIGGEIVAKAAPDGYTLLMMSSTSPPTRRCNPTSPTCCCAISFRWCRSTRRTW